ncbi:MAG: SAM-dependent methyltransferase, partial [Nitrospirae bacterium]|nr:SAM-dependent methyltransferase [Nitrospirota bacterium]
VLEQMQASYSTLVTACSDGYLKRMKTGLQHWIDGGKAGHIKWAVLHFRKQ